MMIKTYYENKEIIREFNNVCKLINLGFVKIPLYNVLMGYWERKSNKDMIQLCGFNFNMNILELGVGTGYLLHLIYSKSKNCKIIGIDYSPSMINETKRYMLLKNPYVKIATDNQLSTISSSERQPEINLILNNVLNAENYNKLKFDRIFTSYLLDLFTLSEIDTIFEHVFYALNDTGVFFITVLDNSIKYDAEKKYSFKFFYYKRMISFYEKCYKNTILKKMSAFLFNGYYTHCRPIPIKAIIENSGKFIIQKTKTSSIRILGIPVLPVMILEVKKNENYKSKF